MAEDNRLISDDVKDHQKQWYSVRDAAEYLGVSQPTIFRWMKEGTLSFYKVGGSTRFSQEGLDAVIEKTTGIKEAEIVAGRCAACGHKVLVAGRLRGAGRLYFRPDKPRFWTFAEAMVPTQARVCMACGYIQLNADTSKLNKLKPKPIGNGEPGYNETVTGSNGEDTT
ncbi:MAG TPA: helix-turn-helix domain-containing protein [Planctomycetes bacterium]|nr:helix-turn-helix domain-containing protein [Planctomycetota bacterium]